MTCDEPTIFNAFEPKLRLLSDPHFLLLYVPNDKGTKMKLIRPATDTYHQSRIIDKIPDKEEKEPAEASILPHYALSHIWGISKANLHLWQEIGDYVDDEKGQPAAPISMRPEKRETLLKLLEHHPDSYWWIDVLCARTDTPLDIMGDIYAQCYKCYALVDCDAAVIPEIQRIGYKHEAVRFPSERILSSLPSEVDVWKAFINCKWWQRVWTWQEMALPKELVFIAETANDMTNDNMVEMSELFYFGVNFHNILSHVDGTEEGDEAIKSWNNGPFQWMYEVGASRSCYRPSAHHIEDIIANRKTFLLVNAFSKSSRQCMDPVDYVYGVLGVFEFHIPRNIEPNQVWQLFLSNLEKTIGWSWYRISRRARHFDLESARNMAHVYQGLVKDRRHSIHCILS